MHVLLVEEHKLNFGLMGEILNSYRWEIYMYVKKNEDDLRLIKLKEIILKRKEN